MSKKRYFSLTIFSIIGFLVLNILPVFGAGTGGGSPTKLDNPLRVTSPNILIGNIINAVLGVVGSIALAMFIYGGLTWMISNGNKENVQKGKDIIIWATLGLVVIFTAYAMVNFVLSDILGQK